MIKAARITLLALLIGTIVHAGHSSWAFVEGPEEVTIKGEVVDMHCYITRHGKEGRGAEHAGCANACLNRSVTAGFVSDDGKLYVLFDEKMTTPKETIAGLAGHPVAVTGSVVERDGVKAFLLKRIEQVKQ